MDLVVVTVLGEVLEADGALLRIDASANTHRR
jgi:hypothetical protein